MGTQFDGSWRSFCGATDGVKYSPTPNLAEMPDSVRQEIINRMVQLDPIINPPPKPKPRALPGFTPEATANMHALTKDYSVTPPSRIILRDTPTQAAYPLEDTMAIKLQDSAPVVSTSPNTMPTPANRPDLQPNNPPNDPEAHLHNVAEAKIQPVLQPTVQVAPPQPVPVVPPPSTPIPSVQLPGHNPVPNNVHKSAAGKK